MKELLVEGMALPCHSALANLFENLIVIMVSRKREDRVDLV